MQNQIIYYSLYPNVGHEGKKTSCKKCTKHSKFYFVNLFKGVYPLFFFIEFGIAIVYI